MFMSVVGNIGAAPLLRIMSPRALLLLMIGLRALSGLLHGMACIEAPGGGTLYPSLPLLYIRSAMHGFTLGSMSVIATWIGARLPVVERPTAQVKNETFLFMGIVLGPAWGSALAILMPTDLQDAGAAGWNVLVVSILTFMFVFTQVPRQEHRRRQLN